MVTDVKRTGIFLIAVLICLLICFGISAAQSAGEVKIGNRVIFRFQDDGKNDPQERAQKVQSRIEELMAMNLGPSDVRIVKENGDYSIYWGADKITTVDPIQAKLNKTTQELLAKTWAGNFKEAITSMAFFLVPARVDMAIHSNVKVKAGGVLKGNIVKEYDTGNVIVTIDQENEEITVNATDPGESKIVFRRGGAKAALLIRILDSPATIDENIETEVSGDPAPKEVLQYAAKNACRSAIHLKPGASIEISDAVRVARTLEAGRKLVAHVPIVITGKGYYTIKKEVQVLLTNSGCGFKDIKTLMVSDRPEAFDSDGVLFSGKFTVDNPTRLLYFHQNSDKNPRRLWIQLKNNSRETVHVMTGGAMGGPSRWGVTVGHMAAMRFLEMYQNAIGYTIQIPPGESVNLIDLQMTNSQVICGYFHMSIRKGKELDVYVKNSQDLDSSNDPEDLPVLKKPFDPFRIHPRGIFEPATIEEYLEYTIGEDDKVSCVVGQAPWLIDPVSGEPNNGNYGVFYKFNVKMKNPTDKIRRIGFYFVPAGILARGSFILDGKIMETGMVRFPSKQVFAVMDLKPGAEKQVTILTTPEGGSYYPISVEVKAMEDAELGEHLKIKSDVEEQEKEAIIQENGKYSNTPIKGDENLQE